MSRRMPVSPARRGPRVRWAQPTNLGRPVPFSPEDRMLVLHGFWLPDDGLCLWAEDSERAVKSPSQALRSARPHPYAAPHGTLAGIHPGKPGEAVLRLPSLRSAPLDSPELIR